MSVLDQLKELDAKRAQLLAGAKEEALKKANDAVSILKELGFDYSLVEAKASSGSGSSGGKRRNGVRQEIEAAIKSSVDGISRSELLEKMNVKGNKSGEQSVSNALSALKKAGIIDANGGVYTVIFKAG